MSKKLYRWNDYLNKMDEAEVVAETEYHWTINKPITENEPRMVPINKMNSFPWKQTYKEALESALTFTEHDLKYSQRKCDEHINQAMHLRKLIKEGEK